MKARAGGWVAGLWLLASGCSSGAASSGSAGSTSSSGGSGAVTEGGSSSPATEHRGLMVHVANVQITGALPNEPSPMNDRLDVTFDLELSHTGTSALTDIRIIHARILDDNGGEFSFGVLGQDWDGRLDAGGSRTVSFHKTPDSAVPHANHALCGRQVRLQVTVQLGPRASSAESRHVAVACTGS